MKQRFIDTWFWETLIVGTEPFNKKAVEFFVGIPTPEMSFTLPAPSSLKPSTVFYSQKASSKRPKRNFGLTTPLNFLNSLKRPWQGRTGLKS